MMVLSVEMESSPKLFAWTRDQYYAMADLGFFDQKCVELIEGQVVEMSPMKSRHAVVVGLVSDALKSILPPGFHVREQLPFIVDSGSEPEPDVALVEGERRDYLVEHPNVAVLVVEVSDSTLAFDRKVKARVYAKAGIPEYWIVNVEEGCLEVFRGPGAEGYAERVTLGREDRVGVMGREIGVEEMLP